MKERNVISITTSRDVQRGVGECYRIYLKRPTGEKLTLLLPAFAFVQRRMSFKGPEDEFVARRRYSIRWMQVVSTTSHDSC
jgi:hypothetical protein